MYGVSSVFGVGGPESNSSRIGLSGARASLELIRSSLYLKSIGSPIAGEFVPFVTSTGFSVASEREFARLRFPVEDRIEGGSEGGVDQWTTVSALVMLSLSAA